MTFLSVKRSILLIVLAIGLQGMSQEIRVRPEGREKLVYDYANFLSAQEEKALNQNLEQFALETSNQILFLSEPTLNDLDPYEYANGILSSWGIGQKELNNGIVILIKPKTGESRGQVFISVAYGLEGAIPDAIAKRIVEQEMLPYFKNGQNYQGVVQAVETLKQLARGEIDAGEYQKKGQDESSFLPILFLLIILLFIFGSRMLSARSYASRNNLGFWAAFWLLSNTNRSHGGSWNHFSGGSGFGGGGGGDFGGFGGGFGGGGGAGGSW